MRYPCRFDIARVIEIIGLGNWDLENWFQLGRGPGVREIDVVFNGSQDRWADSHNTVPIGSIHTENLTVDPVCQAAKFMLQFILQDVVHI